MHRHAYINTIAARFNSYFTLPHHPLLSQGWTVEEGGCYLLCGAHWYVTHY